MANRNITLSLPEDVLRQVKIMAARQGTSISRLLSDTLEEMVARDTGYALAKERSMTMLERGCDLGTQGVIRWSRDELHER